MEEAAKNSCSPRTRGWSPARRVRPTDHALLPAHAGMVPDQAGRPGARRPAPRARGDGPPWVGAAGRRPPLLPAHAGMVPPGHRQKAGQFSAPRARGDGPGAGRTPAPAGTCSPRTRGWSRVDVGALLLDDLLPAHAGMVPPRAFPASRQISAPRARGDGPGFDVDAIVADYCSPRTRGWSRPGIRRAAAGDLLPAHAGMVPPDGSRRRRTAAAPRARGDGPEIDVCDSPRDLCSPRTRGWSLAAELAGGRGQLLPAHAGMVPAPAGTNWS